jgi:hypothetical protein
LTGDIWEAIEEVLEGLPERTLEEMFRRRENAA